MCPSITRLFQPQAKENAGNSACLFPPLRFYSESMYAACVFIHMPEEAGQRGLEIILEIEIRLLPKLPFPNFHRSGFRNTLKD